LPTTDLVIVCLCARAGNNPDLQMVDQDEI
jgi:hypothetical protein